MRPVEIGDRPDLGLDFVFEVRRHGHQLLLVVLRDPVSGLVAEELLDLAFDRRDFSVPGRVLLLVRRAPRGDLKCGLLGLIEEWLRVPHSFEGGRVREPGD